MQINLTCPINQLGYGICSLNILKALAREGHEVSLFPIGGRTECPPYDGKLVDECVQRGFTGFSSRAPSLRIWHQYDLAHHVGNGPHAGFPIFELNKFTAREKHHLEQQDIVFVASGWAKDVVCNNTKKRHSDVVVAPYGVDTSVFTSAHQTTKTTTFINVGKWEYRKGHDVLVKAFNNAFTKDDDVKLVMLNNNPFLAKPQQDEWIQSYRLSPLGNKIEVVENRLPSQQHVVLLMSQADCGVFPSRAEGWGMESAEMLAMGKHVILTNYSAHTEYVNCGNSFLIDIDENEVAYDGVFFKDDSFGGEWAKLGRSQLEQLVESMRAVHRMKQDGALQVNKAGIETFRRLTWQNTAKIIEQTLQTF